MGPKKFHPSDLCGIELNALVCSGHEIIARILKLSNEIPSCFHHDYILQHCSVASLKEYEGKSALSSIWKKISAKKSMKKMMRRQIASYSQSGAITNGQVSTPRNSFLRRDASTRDNRYQSILIDFAYLGDPEKYDSHSHILQDEETEEERRKKIRDQEHLESAFIAEFENTLNEFNQLFSDVLLYYIDICSFAEKLENSHYVQYTIGSLLHHSRGKQLLVEILYLYGSSLIAIEMYIPGTIRERLIIANQRYCKNENISPGATPSNAQTPANNFEHLCKLFQRTEKEYIADETPIVPKRYLDRMEISPFLLDQIIHALMTHDIYPFEGISFPSFKHHSARMSKQSSKLFVILQFKPQLMNQSNLMRQIVDRFLGDNWVIPLYNGELVDLSIEFSENLDALQVLQNAFPESKTRSLDASNSRDMMLWTDEIRRYLDQHILTDLYVLEHLTKLFDCGRNANVALRWRILHRESPLMIPSKKTSKDAHSVPQIDEGDIVDLILILSQFEARLKACCKRLIQDKATFWQDFRRNSISRMRQLSNHFLGKDSLATIDTNSDVGDWFNKMALEIDGLEFMASGQDIQFCVDALTDIGKLDQIDSNAQAKQIILETELDLLRMVKCELVRDDSVAILDSISDAGYARAAIEFFVPIFHSRSLRDPKSVELLRPFFIKIASFLRKVEGYPAARGRRIGAAKTYHSTAMLAFAKIVLDVIPVSIFSTYSVIVNSNEKSLARLPTKINVDSLADHSFCDDRYKLAKLTHELSILTKGIIDMKETMIGDLKMNPQQLLEEGLRKELVRQISFAMHDHLQFPTSSERSKKSLSAIHKVFLENLNLLARRMEGFKSAIVWLQDFLRIDGLDIYLQESTRVIWHSTNMEIGNDSKSCPLPVSSAPIPHHSRTEDDPKSNTFMGRTLSVITKMLDPKIVSYSSSLDGWFFRHSFDTALDVKTVALISKSIGVQGIIGMEYLMSHKASLELDSFYQFYDNALVNYGVMLEKFRDGVFPEWQVPKYGATFYKSTVSKVTKLMVPLANFFSRIGKLQLLRKMLRTELRLGSRINAEELLHTSLVTNGEILSLFLEEENLVLDDRMRNLINASSQLQQSLGEGDPMSTQFTKSNALEGLPSLLALFILHYAPDLSYDVHFQALNGRDDESFDGWVVAAGLGTVLRQFNPAYTKATFSLLGQYVKCALEGCLIKSETEDCSSSILERKKAIKVITFLQHIRDVCHLSQNILNDYIPQHMVEMLDILDE